MNESFFFAFNVPIFRPRLKQNTHNIFEIQSYISVKEELLTERKDIINNVE